MIYRITQDFEDTHETSGDAAALAAELAGYIEDSADMFEDGEKLPTEYQIMRKLQAMHVGDVLFVLDLTITAETAPGFSWFYHDPDAGDYHVIERHADGAKRFYRVLFGIRTDDAGALEADTYTGFLQSKSAAERVLHHLAPAAVLLPGLPAFLR